MPNNWFSNTISAVSLIVCYTATSQIFMPSYETVSVTIVSLEPLVITREITIVNTVAIIFLGTGISFQALISTSCLFLQRKKIMSWAPAHSQTL
jgi:hypothetical protein